MIPQRDSAVDANIFVARGMRAATALLPLLIGIASLCNHLLSISAPVSEQLAIHAGQHPICFAKAAAEMRHVGETPAVRDLA
jgi:hypothetical protein